MLQDILVIFYKYFHFSKMEVRIILKKNKNTEYIKYYVLRTAKFISTCIARIK